MNSSTPLLEGVQILIDRMESTPEDFVRSPDYDLDSPSPKFLHIASALESIIQGQEEGHDRFAHLTAEEKTALLVAYRKMMRQAFTARVIAQLFEPKADPVSKGKQVKISTRAGGMNAALGASFGNAVVKAEGAQIQTDRTLINKQIEAQLREHAQIERDREFKEFTRKYRTSS